MYARASVPALPMLRAPDDARAIYMRVIELIREKDIHVEEGIFQADMMVEIYNDGPVTILLDSEQEILTCTHI